MGGPAEPVVVSEGLGQAWTGSEQRDPEHAGEGAPRGMWRPVRTQGLAGSAGPDRRRKPVQGLQK